MAELSELKHDTCNICAHAVNAALAHAIRHNYGVLKEIRDATTQFHLVFERGFAIIQKGIPEHVVVGDEEGMC